MKYTVIEQFEQPIKQFVDWAGKYDKLIARVQLEDGAEGYLGQRRTVTYIVDEQYSPLAKSCGKVGVLLKLNMFVKLKNGIFNSHSWCNSVVKWYYAGNKEYFIGYNAKYYAENREYFIGYNAKYYAENREYFIGYREENREKIAEYRAKYTVENPEVFRRAYQIRRAVKLAAYSDQQFMSELENSPNRTCKLTGYSLDSSEVRLEHLMPISVNGSFPYGNSEYNCYHLLGSLNISKNNKNVFDWIYSMTESHLHFLLQDYPVELSLEQFRTGMFQIITELAEKQGLILDEYREQYNKDYAEGLAEQETDIIEERQSVAV